MRTWLFACGLLALAGCKHGCGKTPVPFKRDPAPATAAEDAKPEPVAQVYADATRSVKLEEHEVKRDEGSFRASLGWDLGNDGTLDQFVVATDALTRATLETWVQPTDEDEPPARRTAIVLATPNAGCVVEQAGLAKIAPDLALATVDVTCAGDPNPTAAVDPAPPAPEAPADAPPPAPEAKTLTQHQFVVTADVAPKVLLHLAVMPPKDANDPTSLVLLVTSQDQDGDGHGDVMVTAELTESGQAEPTRIPLVWLNRPSGLARERAEPEHTLAAMAEAAAFGAAATDPLTALPAATQVLDAHRVLCQESGAARLWVDESLGLACGSSATAGKAAVIRALALAKQQQLLPALQARGQLEANGYRVEAADRERVNSAIASIRGQTSFVWERGPQLSPPSAPGIRLPAVGFATDNQLLMRGSIGQSYDLTTRTQTPSALAQGVVMSAQSGKFAIVDMVRDCTGQYLRTVPASSIISGFVAGARGADLPLVQDKPAAKGCTGSTRRPDRSGWTVLGTTPTGAILAQGSTLQLVPFDADGKSSGEARLLGPSEPAGALTAPGALSQDGLRHALATSEGIAVIDRGSKPGTTLIRSPASCTGRVSDVAISPSGQRIAMLCSGYVYWAHQTTAPAAPPSP